MREARLIEELGGAVAEPEMEAYEDDLDIEDDEGEEIDLSELRRVETRKALEARAKAAEFFETPLWSARRILEAELLTRHVIDPCAGRGVLGIAARDAGYRVLELDLNEWPDQPNSVRTGVDFLKLDPRVIGEFTQGADFTVFMNPPFSKTCEFVERALDLGARKIVMFQRMAFNESDEREEFFEIHPPARHHFCGSRATCWRGDLPAHERRSSSPTPHQWFVWERGHKGAEVIQRIYKNHPVR